MQKNAGCDAGMKDCCFGVREVVLDGVICIRSARLEKPVSLGIGRGQKISATVVNMKRRGSPSLRALVLSDLAHEIQLMFRGQLLLKTKRKKIRTTTSIITSITTEHTRRGTPPYECEVKPRRSSKHSSDSYNYLSLGKSAGKSRCAGSCRSQAVDVSCQGVLRGPASMLRWGV